MTKQHLNLIRIKKKKSSAQGAPTILANQFLPRGWLDHKKKEFNG